MELREPIEKINYQLEREFGKAFNNQPNFRVVWSEDQYEKRKTDRTDEGFQLLVSEVRLLPKYRQYIHEKYILERLIPIVGETDLVVNVNYEPCWVFQDSQGNYLPLRFDACKIVVQTLYSQMGKKDTFKKYKDPEADPGFRLQQLEDIEEELFGNETEVGDSMAYKEAIVVPRNYEKGEVE